MDKTKTAVAVGLTVAVAGILGYAYIVGVGPLEENPAAGLEEPPETESTYSFGDVPETGTGSGANGGSDGQVDDETDTQSNPGTDEVDGGADEDTNQAGDDGTDTESSMEANAAGEDTESRADEGADGGGDEETDDSDDADDDGDDDSDAEEDADGQDDDTDDRTGDTDDADDDGTDRGSSGGDGGSDRVGGGGVDRAGDTETNRRGTTTSTLDTGTRASGPPFVPELENMEECGETCREGTVALQNKMNVEAENVVVYVRLHAGDSTDSDDVVWAENRNLGTLAPGEVYRETETVDLTPQQANKVRETDGVVTAKATVESDQATATFVEQDSVE